MERFCSVPIGYKDTKFGKKYDRCGGNAVYKVKNSDWYVCEEHAAYANKQRWELEKLREN